MRKVHITLIGGQTIPIYRCIKAVNPDLIVYIYSNSSEPEYRRISEMLEIEEDRQEPLDAVDPTLIRARAEALADKYKDDYVTLNITGGLKSWTYLFSAVFAGRDNVDVLYLDQNNQMWNYSQMSGSDAAVSIDMQTLFKLTGNPLVKFTDLQSYTEDDETVALEVEKLRKFDYAEFTSLLSTLSKEDVHHLKNDKEGKINSKKSLSYVIWRKCDDGREEIEISLRKGGSLRKDLTIGSEHAISLAFNTGWFEYKVAKLLSKWLEAENVYLNCTFPFAPNLDRNEVDIIVETKNRLLFVECKTQIYNSTDIDKFSTVVRRYGGSASMSLFVTEYPMKNMARDKCISSDMMVFSLNDENRNIQSYKKLFELLDNTVKKIRK